MSKLTKYSQLKHGMKVKCKIDGEEITDARISINGDGRALICQNYKDGLWIEDRLGYKYSWFFAYKDDDSDRWERRATEVTDLESVEESKPLENEGVNRPESDTVKGFDPENLTFDGVKIQEGDEVDIPNWTRRRVEKNARGEYAIRMALPTADGYVKTVYTNLFALNVTAHYRKKKSELEEAEEEMINLIYELIDLDDTFESWKKHLNRYYQARKRYEELKSKDNQ